MVDEVEAENNMVQEGRAERKGKKHKTRNRTLWRESIIQGMGRKRKGQQMTMTQERKDQGSKQRMRVIWI